MKILHCCLAAFYIDNYSYQENILPQMHKLQGHEVAIIASTETYVKNEKIGFAKAEHYCTNESIPITRLPYSKVLPHILMRKLRIYKGLLKSIEEFGPDILFLHGCQFISIRNIKFYAKKHPKTKIYVDGHTDFINSGKNWFSKNIMHKIVWKHYAQLIEPYTKKFFGVLPLRVEFFKTVYGIPCEKVELLVLGADNNSIDFSKKDDIRASIRKTLNIDNTDFVVITGGKIDKNKNIHKLMKAINEMQEEKIKLIVFGSPNETMKNEIIELAQGDHIRYIGWIPSKSANDYYLASDLGCFPGTHSVLWEQAVGVGLPCIFKKWEGIQHVNVGGNCIFLDSDDIQEIKRNILTIYRNRELYIKMKQAAVDNGISRFSYYEIANRAISD